MGSPMLVRSNKVAMMLLLCLALSCSLSVEGATTKVKSKRHLEVSAYVVSTDLNHDDANKEDKEVEDDATEEEDQDDGEKIAASIVAESQNEMLNTKDPHSAERAVLQKAAQHAARELAGNEAEQAHIKANMKHLNNDAASKEEINKRANKVSSETGSKAMGAMFGKIWREVRMFEVPSFNKRVEGELVVLDEDKKDLEAKVKKAKANLAASEKKWMGDAKKDSSKLLEGAPKTPLPSDAEIKEIHAKAANPHQHHTSNKVNVWGMSAQTQRSIFIGSIVYLSFGILFAYLYHQARDLYPKVFVPEVRHEVFPSTVGFTFGLFEFFSDRNLCILGCCCPFLRWADTVDRQGLLSYWKAFITMFLLLLLHVYTYGISDIGVIMLGVVFRQKLRSQFLIESGTFKSYAYDCLAWTCCQPCAIIQEAREHTVQRGAGAV